MLSSRVHMKFLEHFATERALGQHALDRDLNCTLRVLFQHLSKRNALDAANSAGVMEVQLVGQLRACNGNLLGIDDNDVIAAINVRRVGSLVLATQAHGQRGGQAAKRLSRRIDDEPIAAHRLGLFKNRVHGILRTVGPAKDRELYGVFRDLQRVSVTLAAGGLASTHNMYP